MNDTRFELLSEIQASLDFVDDVEFADVTHQGEVYTLYRIVRFTHRVHDHPDGWTHMANVARVREPAFGVALLRIVDRVIEDSQITLSDTRAD